MILWVHALAALLFALLALREGRRAGSTVPRLAFTVGLAATALWALAVAGIGAADPMAALAESARNLAWLGFMFALVRRDRRAAEEAAILTIYGVAALIVVAGGVLAAIAAALPPAQAAALQPTVVVFRMMVAVAALLLVHQLHHAVAPDARAGVRLLVLALADMWLVDLGIYGIVYFGAGGGDTLVAVRGLAMVLVAPIFALAVHRNGDWSLQLSRTMAYQSLTLGAAGLYVMAMAMAMSGIATLGGAQARLIQTAFVFGSTAALFALVSTPWLRAWARVKLAKHLFRHRYDYRSEWLRFTDTLGEPGAGAPPLDERIIKAVADLTDSPGGLLLVRDGAGLVQRAAWNWPGAEAATDARLPDYLAATARIVAIDDARSGTGDAAEAAAVPAWMCERSDAWVLVPLIHFGRLTGAILLARPPIDRRPDWEDLDLLRLAGRQVASYLAEARAQGALAEAARFDEFNRRFAFILHDIKNLVSQLSLVARNAERHADNPDFRRDMVASLNETTARMNSLLARLSQHHQRSAEPLAPVPLWPIIERVAARRREHPVVAGGLRDAVVLADPARVEQLLGHLVQNAVEASPAAAPVAIDVAEAAEGITISVVDQGAGMSAAFIRDQLFKPFVSTKSGGFGLGAFEARQLAEAMGGSVSVDSREGAGTRFCITLRAADKRASRLEEAA
ncbi:XrtA/PEP-CTERM system histidine kinase PrsK [Sphingomonas sp.]|uniref:XrtA/PEP-CTERM system histidine kinase PrsK n=1 Tax=Sphingomonas sp. TaxID=28214 RepID=UPI001D74C927|nr:XrtA/PEP-CTERM system histidine kinase PrsK [Sphingomonas sp.]MBX9796596.1 PEP-CTERM system histidine kinase PrsK [Sphingomonas sp.]